MTLKIDVSLPISFEDGQVLITLQGQRVDLMKLDSIQEFHTVFKAIATEAVGGMLSPNTGQSGIAKAPDFPAAAEKLRQAFQDISDRADRKLAEYANVSNEHPAG